MKTLVVANQKGGVGKSAVATMLSHYFALKGLRVLAVDLDHQGNFSAPLQMSRRVEPAASPSDALLTQGVVVLPQRSFVLIPSSRALLGLERQPSLHNTFARNFRAFLSSADSRFDVCVVDTNPNPDIRLIAALASADHVLSPIQLNQEAIDGVSALLDHERVGLRKIKAVLNPKLRLIGLLPTMVEATPFQRTNMLQIVKRYQSLLIPLSQRLGDVASMPRRSAIGEAQSHGEVLWEMKKTAARDAWREIEPSVACIAGIVLERAESGVAPA